MNTRRITRRLFSLRYNVTQADRDRTRNASFLGNRDPDIWIIQRKYSFRSQLLDEVVLTFISFVGRDVLASLWSLRKRWGGFLESDVTTSRWKEKKTRRPLWRHKSRLLPITRVHSHFWNIRIKHDDARLCTRKTQQRSALPRLTGFILSRHGRKIMQLLKSDIPCLSTNGVCLDERSC